MAELGNFSIILAWLTTFIALAAGTFAGATGRRRWTQLSINAMGLAFLCTGTATLTLLCAFLADDFSIQYVWEHSNRSMALIYKISALWGGLAGSMLTWCLCLSGFGALLVIRIKNLSTVLQPWIIAVFASSNLFFLSIAAFSTNPFRYVTAQVVPLDGSGLNPLLQNPYMAIHPPLLYLGFTGLAVPYAICMGALLSGHLSNEWIRAARSWALTAWIFLTLGISFGAFWAYIELGWGGFWAWDPVENAALLPWLTVTAYLHSAPVYERRGMLKIFTILLAVLSYALTVFGTFLTRSGVVQSVHAFAADNAGSFFLPYLAFVLLTAAAALFLRRAQLKPAANIGSLLSREAASFLNNLLLLGICGTVLWGTLFPLISEAALGEQQFVGTQFYNQAALPLFFAVLILMGLAPHLNWGKNSIKLVCKRLTLPFLGAALATLILAVSGVHTIFPLLGCSLPVFVMLSIAVELRRNRSYCPGYLVHVGVAVCALAITASIAFKQEEHFTLGIGDTYTVGRYSLSLQSLKELIRTNHRSLFGEIKITRVADGSTVATVNPEIRRYFQPDQTTAEVALYTGISGDIYLVMTGYDSETNKGSFKVHLNPLQVWLWIGIVIMILGAVAAALLPHNELKKIDSKY